jgi:hypothetical protein
MSSLAIDICAALLGIAAWLHTGSVLIPIACASIIVVPKFVKRKNSSKKD